MDSPAEESHKASLGTDRSAANLVGAFFSRLDERGFDYVVAGNPSELPSVPGDVDIVLSQNHFDLIRRDLDIWFHPDAVLVQSMRHEASAVTYVMAHRVELGFGTPTVTVQFDVCSDYVRASRNLISAASILEGRRRYTPPTADFSVWTPSPTAAFTYYLVKKVAKGHIDTEAIAYLHRLLLECAEPPPIELYFGVEGTKRALAAITDLDIGRLREILPGLWSEVVGRWPRRPRDVLLEFGRIAGRLSHPTGLLVELKGPDSSLARATAEELATSVRKVFRRSSIRVGRVGTWALPKVLMQLATAGLVVKIVEEGKGVSDAFPRIFYLSIELADGEPVESASARVVDSVLTYLERREWSRLIRLSHQHP